MAAVIDASVTIAWCYRDEANRYTEAMLDQVRADSAIVPSIWPLEVANALIVGERRGRLTQGQSTYFRELLRALPIIVDHEGMANFLWETTMALARAHGLSVYDASYLELATREGLSLATQDARLGAAATQIGIVLVPSPADGA